MQKSPIFGYFLAGCRARNAFQDVVEVWEGLVTFLMFPVLVVLAFMADKGWFSRSDDTPDMTKSVSRWAILSSFQSGMAGWKLKIMKNPMDFHVFSMVFHIFPFVNRPFAHLGPLWK